MPPNGNESQHPYHNLTAEEANHFLTHGWLKVANAINPQYLDRWVAELWDRTGYSATDPSTWEYEYLHLPFHHQVPAYDFAPSVYAKIADICGGDDRIDPVRERWVGDNFIVNFGSEERTKLAGEKSPQEKKGWHCDNDWFRQFLDSEGTALTLICCFSDIPENGGGTWLCEDGIAGVVKHFYNHPEGLDPGGEPSPTDFNDHIQPCKQFVRAVAKKGDVFITHGLLPHTASWNFLHYPRIITNIHVTLREPMNLNRADGDYSLVEQVILRNLGRDALPEWKPTRERRYYYPRNIAMKMKRIDAEVERMIKAAEARGEDRTAVDSIWLKGPQAKADFERVNGFLLPVNEETGLLTMQHDIG